MSDTVLAAREVVAVDTNVLLRATLNEAGLETESAAARRILASGRQDVLIADVTIVEYVHALETHYHLSRSMICELVSTIARLRHVSCSGDVILAALARFCDKPTLSFNDCFIAEHARANRAVPLWTFDPKLANQYDLAALVTSAPASAGRYRPARSVPSASEARHGLK